MGEVVDSEVLIEPETTSFSKKLPETCSFSCGFVVPIPILKFSLPTNQYLLGLASVLIPTAN